jgi:tRNA dimethylallyltransferase
LELAAAAVRQILARGRVPLFVGGTGLYLRALLRGVFNGPAADWEFRRQCEQQVQQHGAGWLHQQLAVVDPPTANRLSPQDVRRVIRALEVQRVTGQPLSELQRQEMRPVQDRPSHVFWLDPPRGWLHERINRRVVVMFHEGLVAEVQRLQAELGPHGWSRTARQALGYREILDWLDNKQPTLDEVVRVIQARTRQFAKRQGTWFRNLAECRAVPLTGHETAAAIAERLQELV